jgi:V8-like Glu-specific endopeptidase
MKTQPLRRTLRIAFVVLFALVLFVPLVGAQPSPPESERVAEPAATAPSDHISDSPYMRIPEDLSDWPPLLAPEPGSFQGVESADPGAIVTYDRATGTTVEIPSADLTKPGELGQSTTPAYSGLLPEGMGIETVFPPDDRTRVTNTADYPWRTVAKLFITFPDGARGWCSGAIIGCQNNYGYKVLTAGHCVYSSGNGGWASSVVVYPGLDYGYTPYYYALDTRLTTWTAWINNQDPGYDMGIVDLDRNIGNFTGWMGRITRASGDAIYSGGVNTAGYPCNAASGSCPYPVSPVDSMWFDFDYGNGATELNHYYYMDTQPGQSGSPVWLLDAGNRYIMTVHAYSSSPTNFGTRLNQSKFDTLVNLCADTTQYPVPTDKPDLIDDGSTWSGLDPSTVVPGSTAFHAWSDVRNAGTANSGSFYVQYRASTNTTCDGSDFLIGTDLVGGINAFAWADSDWTGTFPPGLAHGTYYLCWIIDSGGNVPEFSESNNTAYKSSPRIYVGAAPTKAFLPLVFSRYSTFVDPYEPNDSFDQAWGPLTSNQTYSAYLPTETDNNDFYYFNMPATHSIEVWLTNLPAGNDYDLYLYDEAHVLIGYSAAVGSSDEHIYLGGRTAQKYYIRVARITGSSDTQPYQLRVVYQ